MTTANIVENADKVFANGVPNPEKLLADLGIPTVFKAVAAASEKVSQNNNMVSGMLDTIGAGINKAIAAAGGALDMNNQPEQTLAANTTPQGPISEPGKGGAVMT